MITSYQCLKVQEYKKNEFSLVPIRLKDRYKIMQWRNEQIDHLRQTIPLTKEKQDEYFNTVVLSLFNKEDPEQILFSFLKNEVCIGYGGLVHIDWTNKTAEISFIMNTAFEEDNFVDFWLIYLNLIEQVAFLHLQMSKIFTYSYEIRPKLYKVMELTGYKEEKRIKNVLQIKGKTIDALIYSKWKTELTLIKAKIKDSQSLFDWANDSETRKNSICSKKIIWNDHLKWFQQKINSKNTEIFIVYEKEPIGTLRIDKINDTLYISFNVLAQYRGKGYGHRIILLAVEKFSDKPLVAEVLEENISSQKIFERNKFIIENKLEKNGKKVIQYIKR